MKVDIILILTIGIEEQSSALWQMFVSIKPLWRTPEANRMLYVSETSVEKEVQALGEHVLLALWAGGGLERGSVLKWYCLACCRYSVNGS